MAESREALDRVARFAAHLRATKAVRTSERYATAARELEIWFERAHVDVRRAPPGLLDHFVQYLVEVLEYKPRTVRVVAVAARRYWTWRRKQGEDLPAIEPPDVPHVLPGTGVALSEEELARFLGSVLVLTEPTRSALLTCAYAGLRTHECTALELGHVIELRDPTERGASGRGLLVTGKGNKPRVVPVHPTLEKLLILYLTRWRAVTTSRTGVWLFPGLQGRAMVTRTLRKAMGKIAPAIGREDVTPHALRRTFVTWLDGQGISPMQIAQLVGHTRPTGLPDNLGTTQRYYIHHTSFALLEALRRVRFPNPSMGAGKALAHG